MRLVILGPYPTDPDIRKITGGVQAVIVNLVKGLSEFKDLDLHIVTSDARAEYDTDFISLGTNVHVVTGDKRFGNIAAYPKTRKKLCMKIKELKPDLIHSHGLSQYSLAALECGCKNIIMSTHGIMEHAFDFTNGVKDGIRKIFEYRMQKLCLDMAGNIVINSPYARKIIGETHRRTIYELDNPVSDIFFNAPDNLEEEASILFAGTISESKGVMTLLRSLNILKDRLDKISFKLAGPITDQGFYRKALRYIRDNRLDGYVSFMGHLNEEELKKEYEKASIFAFPSNKDVAPLSVLQAMAAGKAIVASGAGGMPYIINDGTDGFLVRAKDFKSLADRILSFIKDKELRKSLGANARKKASANSIGMVAPKLYAIYREVIG